jgi:hypothetical protein
MLIFLNERWTLSVYHKFARYVMYLMPYLDIYILTSPRYIAIHVIY